MIEKRKTLADIRRGIDAEFSSLVDETRPHDDVDAVDDHRALEALRVPPRRDGRRRRTYLKVAIFGAVVVEVFILGYAAGRLYRDEPAGPMVSTVTGASSAPVPAASVMSGPAETPSRVVAVQAEPSPARDVRSKVVVESAAPPERNAVPSVSASAPPAMVAATREPIPPAPASDVRRVMPEPNRGSPETSGTAPEPRRVAPEQRRVTPDATLVTLVLPGPGDWVESQSQLRAALREWLKLSGYAGPSSDSENAEVVLGADGQTAKTRVPVRVAGHVIVREQRWRRDARGWNLVEDSQVQSPRPG